MNRHLLAFVLLSLLPIASSAQMPELVAGYMAAWNKHDAAAAAAFLDEEVDYYDASVGSSVKGRSKAQAEIIEAFLQAVPNLKWTMDDTAPIAGTDGIAFQWTFSGTNTGSWSDGTPATNKDFSIRGATLMKISNGKIVFQGDYYDAYGFYQQLGLAE